MSDHTYRIKQVAEITGLSAHVIRVWERRHDLFIPTRAPNRYRLFSDSDVQLLLYLKAQTEAGRGIGQLAKLGAAKLREEMAQTPVELPDVPAALRMLAHGIVRSARWEDHAQVRQRVHNGVRQLGIEHAMRHLLMPAIQAVGELWHRGEISTSGEQAITMAVRHELIEAIGSEGQDQSRPLVLVACVPGEFHEIGALTVAMLLTLASWRAVYLGPDTGIEVIHVACERRRPTMVVLSSTMDQRLEQVRKLVDRLCARVRPHCPVLVGGAGASPYQDLLASRDIVYVNDITTLKTLAPSSLPGPDGSRDARGGAGPREEGKARSSQLRSPW